MLTKFQKYAVNGAPYEIYGLSTDTKPTDVFNGSAFYEMDTGKIYLFDAETKTWLEQ